MNQQSPPATHEERAAMLSKLLERDWVTFAECEANLPGFSSSDGLAICHGRDQNIVFWVGIDQAWANTLLQMIEERRIFWQPAPSGTLPYYVDGRVLDMPVVGRPPPKGYKTPHWLPMCIRTVPPEEPTPPHKQKATAGRKRGR